jgi:endo-1,4-beta-xylanase
MRDPLATHTSLLSLFSTSAITIIAVIMGVLLHLTLALAAIGSSLAAPSPSPPVEKRGPHDFVMGPDHPLMLARRNLTLAGRSTNYNQDYTTGGTVYFAPASDEFYVSWDTTDDFVVGVGWNPGSTL